MMGLVGVSEFALDGMGWERDRREGSEVERMSWVVTGRE